MNGELEGQKAIVAKSRPSLASRIYSILRQRSAERKGRARRLRLLRTSPLFDRDWYLAKYPDVAASGVDPALHFLESGWREGRDPGPDFATLAYLKANADVARSGINPLLHFIEFGQSEGRGLPAHGPFAYMPASCYGFGEPFPVFRARAAQDPPVRWQRSYDLPSDDERLFDAGDMPVGYVDDRRQRLALSSAFARLRSLSGFGNEPGEAGGKGSASLIDAWFVNEAQLRTRWSDGPAPFVVRAYQHDPLLAGKLTQIGEGLAASPLDFVDLNLGNPYFPVLVLFADADAVVRGWRLLAFPSLCRGGLHYPELLASTGVDDSPNPLAFGLMLAERLRDDRALIGAVAIDPEPADGTSPLFQPPFRTWIERVCRIEVAQEPAAGKATLVLATDMIPTIGALCEGAGSGDGVSGDFALPLLIAGAEPSQPAISLDLPPTSAPALRLGAKGYPPAWPRLVGGPLPEGFPPAAIRLPAGRELTDSELLIPAMGDALPLGEADASITWIVEPARWQQDALAEALQALSLQDGGAGQGLAIIGPCEAAARDAAARLFGKHVRTFVNLKAAVDGLETELAGYLGPGVVLHDPRTSALLSTLLRDETIVSACCVLVAPERRGKGWHVSVVDDSHKPLRACFPVAEPPRDLWLARAASLRDWVAPDGGEKPGAGIHLCTSLVTASSVGERSAGEGIVPPNGDEGAMKTRALFG